MRYVPSSPLRTRHRTRSQSGFSLVEVLVSIVVLSFGLLGMVGLQASALKYNRDARSQSVAISLARELAEMMRANAQVAAKSATTNPYYGAFSGAGLAPATTSTCLNPGSNCADATAVANAQMTEWLSRVENALPGAQVTVCDDAQPYDTNGLPVWACTATTTGVPTTVIKLGWKREDFNKSLVDAATNKPFVLLPVTPGGQS